MTKVPCTTTTPVPAAGSGVPSAAGATMAPLPRRGPPPERPRARAGRCSARGAPRRRRSESSTSPQLESIPGLFPPRPDRPLRKPGKLGDCDFPKHPCPARALRRQRTDPGPHEKRAKLIERGIEAYPWESSARHSLTEFREKVCPPRGRRDHRRRRRRDRPHRLHPQHRQAVLRHPPGGRDGREGRPAAGHAQPGQHRRGSARGLEGPRGPGRPRLHQGRGDLLPPRRALRDGRVVVDGVQGAPAAAGAARRAETRKPASASATWT